MHRQRRRLFRGMHPLLRQSGPWSELKYPASGSYACRKSNPNILMMQSAEDWAAKNVASSLNTT